MFNSSIRAYNSGLAATSLTAMHTIHASTQSAYY